MRITDAKVIVCSPSRNFVTLKISTEDGIYGLGDATLNGRELAVASYSPITSSRFSSAATPAASKTSGNISIKAHTGAAARSPWPPSPPSTPRSGTSRVKPSTFPSINFSAAPSRDGILVYGHASGNDIDDTVDAVAEYANLGYKAIRAQSGIPGLDSTYGVGRGKMFYEPAEKDAPVESAWSPELYMNFVPRLFERLRKEFGPERPLLHDVHHRLTPIEAARLGKELEPYHLFWLEDPTPAEVQESFRLIRRHTTTPLAVGEVFNSICDCKQLIQEQFIDYIRTDRGARRRHQPSATHRQLGRALSCQDRLPRRHRSSPVCMAAALHFDLCIHNFGIQEYMRHTDETDASSRTTTPSPPAAASRRRPGLRRRY